MPAIQIADPIAQADGSFLVVVDVTGTGLASTLDVDEGGEVRRLRHFTFGSDIPSDALDVVTAQLRAELSSSSTATDPPPDLTAMQTVDL